MHLLPTTLAPMSAACDLKSPTMVYSGVRVRLAGDDTFTAESTNGKVAIRVSGHCQPDNGDYPISDKLRSAPNGEIESIVPGKAWKAAMSDASKIVKSSNRKAVAVVCGKEVTTIGATNGGNESYSQSTNLCGRMPNIADVIPAESAAIASITIDPGMLASILKACDDLNDNDEMRGMTIEIHKDGHFPSVVIRGKGQSYRIDAIVVGMK
jgi:hypothetical protein